MSVRMTVTSRNREPVRVRAHPSTSAETIARLKVGTPVEAGDELNGWRRVVYGDNQTGYMMERFLIGETDGDRTLTEREYRDLCDAKTRLEDALRSLRQIVG